ncbi:MAG: ER lumen protein-retaining receptor [archaeon]|nr:ER lumen protein-retaining receptor [archaeon]
MRLVLILFEVSYLFQHIASIFQIIKIRKKKNSELISLETNVLFLIGAFSRLGWIWDSMLHKYIISYLEIALAVITLVYLIYLYQKNKVRNYAVNEIKLPPALTLACLIPLSLILSFFINPGDTYFTDQYFVSLGIFSEALGLLPQFYMIRKSKDTGDISELYIVFLGIARFCRLLFWIKMYFEGAKFIGLIIADFLHCVVLSGFIYNVIVNWGGKGLPISFSELNQNSNKKMF